MFVAVSDVRGRRPLCHFFSFPHQVFSMLLLVHLRHIDLHHFILLPVVHHLSVHLCLYCYLLVPINLSLVPKLVIQQISSRLLLFLINKSLLVHREILLLSVKVICHREINWMLDFLISQDHIAFILLNHLVQHVILFLWGNLAFKNFAIVLLVLGFLSLLFCLISVVCFCLSFNYGTPFINFTFGIDRIVPHLIISNLVDLFPEWLFNTHRPQLKWVKHTCAHSQIK